MWTTSSTASLRCRLRTMLMIGVIPLPVPILFPDVPIPINKIPAQTGTDLQYIRQLAD